MEAIEAELAEEGLRELLARAAAGGTASVATSTSSGSGSLFLSVSFRAHQTLNPCSLVNQPMQLD